MDRREYMTALHKNKRALEIIERLDEVYKEKRTLRDKIHELDVTEMELTQEFEDIKKKIKQSLSK